MPVYNEIGTITRIVEKVRKAPVDVPMELIIVDDASTDGTQEVLEKLRAESSEQIRILFHEVNRGKGAAVRSGFARANGQIIVIQDVDLEYDSRDYPRLLEPIFDDVADLVFGNRFGGGPHRVLYFWHYVGNRVLTLLTNIATGLNPSDMEAGYKVFRADVLRRKHLKSDRFGFEPEVVIKVAKLGCRIYEVPIRYYGRTYQEGKKIGWRDGLAAVFHIVRHRFFD
jgi:glycosyltransferase involved in cell wall biosynthesis